MVIYLFVRDIESASGSTIFLLDFETLLMVYICVCWYVYNITIMLFNCTFIETMVKWKKTKGQTMIYKTLHIKLKIE